MHELTRTYPCVIEVPVAWGDMDAFQHVNNTVYFRYFEGARIAYFEKLEMMDFMQGTGIGPILAATQCRFKFPLTYPDRVSVGAQVETMAKDRFTMRYVVVTHTHGKIAATGDGEVVTFDYRAGKKTELPEELRQRIIALEKSVGHEVG